ncbi:TraB/GumN family protein [Aurantiacibacter sp. D1-12]|uniref:TraB/GumN family protein n=1 Tax=Aurantiacibacter sp. D1-12 TaxID=2993658 RepID=UPI00237C8C62|nr:TraB/GumN family protein [Aurantiacibacter sp. D1-12]MDE1466691.1 TraB/GumN family protein [Aurantiacibacter sp. D1-12]
MRAMIVRFSRALLLAPLAFLAAVPAAAQSSDSAAADRYAFTQEYAPDPAIWVIRDDDTTIYMLGTIHALPRGFRWRSPRINEVIEESDVLVVETSEYAQAPDAINADTKLIGRIARREPTSQQLSPAAAAHWRNLVEQSFFPFESIDTMPVMLALLSLGSTGDGSGTSLSAFGVETILEREFRARRRPIEVIEDSGAVTYRLLRLENAEIIEDLEARLIAWDGKPIGYFYNSEFEERTGNDYWQAEHAWARGEVAEDFSLGFGEGAIGDALDELLLDRRNTEWAQWLEERLEQPGTTLVAVGAGHFEGDVSLLVKLRERGIGFERIN